MLNTHQDLIRNLKLVYPGRRPPRPLDLLVAIERIKAGEPLGSVAAEYKTTKGRLDALARAQDAAAALFGGSIPQLSVDRNQRVRRNVGQLILGKLAERAFEDIYRTNMGAAEFRLEDDTLDRTDTDYRVLNGQSRRVFRVNIKFFGSAFRRATELVGLSHDDCFALATYKIHRALEKQEAEHLPYIFIIVGVAGLTGAVVGATIPEDLVHLVGLAFEVKQVQGKRGIEDAVVACLTNQSDSCGYAPVVQEYYGKIRNSPWFILSARRAEELLKKKLFTRCYALAVPRFARSYPNAEVDMHFSLREDLTPLPSLFQVLRDEGLQGLISRLERGTY